MKKLLLIAALLSCHKSSFHVSTWEVWRATDTVKEVNHAYFCNGHREGTKTLSLDDNHNEHSYLMAIDSIVIRSDMDSFVRSYIQWRHKIN